MEAKCKFEDMRIARQHIKLKSSLFTFDIHLAYHHVDIYEPHTEFFGFSWTVNGCITFFNFIVLPLRLSTACYLFTKRTRLVY
jgi:hypothetical protein